MDIPSASSTKRARPLNVGGQVAACLVDGCNSDLGKCREYHRRHRVCELHSKTPTVTVRGQELRFCQQCSKFHSLSEFDDEKRSCRKRLDGHNRRRRKPQPDAFSLAAGRFLSRLPGSRYDPSSMLDEGSLGRCSWQDSVEAESYGGRNPQILKFGDPNATMFPGSTFPDSRTQPQHLPANGFLLLPSAGVNRAIAPGLALSLLSPSLADSPFKCWSRPAPPEADPSPQPWISPASQYHRNTAEKPASNTMLGLESNNDSAFHRQGLYSGDNIDGIRSSSPYPAFSSSWD